MRDKISKILVKWSMPTRQAAISELVSLFQSEMEKAVDDLFSEDSDMWLNGYDWDNFPEIVGIIEKEQRKKLKEIMEG